MRKLSIVIPIYNEEKTLGELLRRVFALKIPGWEVEIIAVDDASKDKTSDILSTYMGRLKIIRHATNQGKGVSVQDGLELATGDFMVIQDADLEYDPKEIAHLAAEAVDAKTIVYGSRNLHHERRRGFFVQRWGTTVTTMLINMLYGSRLTDVWTCYKVFPATAKHLYTGKRFEGDILFTIRTLRMGYRAIEHPISHRPRGVGEGKKIRYRDGLYALFLIVKDRLSHLTSDHISRVDSADAFIVDPKDRKPLRREAGVLIAQDGKRYRVDDQGRPYLMSPQAMGYFADEHESGINWLKTFFKQFPRLYYALWHLFCPVLMLVNGPRNILRYVTPDSLVVDIGSGPKRLGKNVVNVDVVPFPEVDIVADGLALPFADNSIPAIVSEAVLEHVERPEWAIRELMRVLSIGGYAYVSVPFMTPYHASPDDFTRWTLSGLKRLFEGHVVVESGVRSGPMSAFLMFCAYWFGVVLSFGSKKAAPFVTHVLMLVLGPLKFFDYLFWWMPGADAVAAHLYVIVKKSDVSTNV